MTIRHTIWIALAASGPAASVRAQFFVSPDSKFVWSENAGHLNFHDAGTLAGAQGVRVAGSFLTGFAWGENTGWINLGDGSGPYTNTNGTNFGVNHDSNTGLLTGFAWAENVGWINFSGGALATPANPARIDSAALRLRGYAWGENSGWISLDDAVEFVGLTCPSDVDDGSGTGTPDGGVTIDDLLYFLFIFEVGELRADVDDGSSTGTPDGGVTIDDLLYYLFRFEAGC